MATQDRDHRRSESAANDPRILQGDGTSTRPFLRGIMVHSLMARGVGFEDALSTAEHVRDRLRGRGDVGRAELAKLVEDFLGEKLPADHQPPLPPLPAPIIVTGKRGSRAPFSKGRISQSLLAASIDPNDAFQVAQEIEQGLLLAGHTEVTRRELRRRANEVLLSRFGKQTAERFLIWRRHQEPEKPVILLLGGTTGCGKTSLALEVAQRLGISRVVSTDSIRQILRLTLTRELVPAIHASSFEADPNRIYEPDEDPVLTGFHSQASVVAAGVRATLDRAIEENTSLILDGVSLVPGLIDLERYRDTAHVIFLIVVRLDETAFRSHFISREQDQKRRSAQRYVEHLDAILTIQENFLELADRFDVPIVDNVTIDGSVLLVIRHVLEALRKEGGYDLSELD